MFFLYDAEANQLVAKYASGEGSEDVIGLRIGLGQRLSGWVAANRQTIVNSDAMLDLGDTHRGGLRLRSCLSSALMSNGELVGVVSVYSLSRDAFTENHRQALEGIAPHISNLFTRVTDVEGGPGATTLDHPVHKREDLLAASLHNHSILAAGAMAIVFIDIAGLNRIHHDFGPNVADDVLRHVVKHTRSHLRTNDILFRHGSDELVALLYATDLDFAQLLADRIRTTVREEPIAIGDERLYVDVDIASVHASRDVDSLPDSMRTARVRSDSVRTNVAGVHS